MDADLPMAIPCPWCGAVPGIDDVIGEYNEGGLCIRLRCPNGDQECMAEGPWTIYLGESLSPEDLFKEAVIPWNTRHESGKLTTSALVAELEKREGVTLYDTPDCDHVYDVYVRKYGDEFSNGETHDGPAKILVVVG